ncbi:MAG TPA: thioredoxin family protein [Kofleriaceae bacterium]
MSEPTRDEVDRFTGATVLEFGASWCGYCTGARPLVDAALAGRDLRHLWIEDGRGKRLGRTFRVKLWPTLIFLRDGQEVARVVRPTRASELTDALAALGL